MEDTMSHLTLMRSMLALSLATAACGSDDAKSYVLVHGAWMGADGWSEVAAELRDGGDTVATPELPGHGADTTPVGQLSLQLYADTVIAAIDAAPKPVTLVAHSMGGVVATQVAEQRPDDVAELIYVAAYAPTNDQSLFDLAMIDSGSQLGPSLQFGEDGTIGVASNAFVNLFCADCTDDAKATLLAGYRPEPAAPLQQKVAITATGAGRVPKAYVFTSQDLVVSPGLQSQMALSSAPARQATLDTSHAAMLSQPAQLARAIKPSR
jgi:pimeloyl-ACP methyl ester carboxylesterase